MTEKLHLDYMGIDDYGVETCRWRIDTPEELPWAAVKAIKTAADDNIGLWGPRARSWIKWSDPEKQREAYTLTISGNQADNHCLWCVYFRTALANRLGKPPASLVVDEKGLCRHVYQI